jgi:hypothetical protein
MFRPILRSFARLDHTNSTCAEPRKTTKLNNIHTNWDDFRHLINDRLTSNVSLKTAEDIKATVKFFYDTIQWVGWNATSDHTDTLKTYELPYIN